MIFRIIAAWLRDPWILDQDGARNSLRWNIAIQLHRLTIAVYNEQYWCNCGRPACNDEVGLPYVCTHAREKTIHADWESLDLGSAGQLEDLTGQLS